MPKPYGVILTNAPTRVTRAIVQEGGTVILQSLKVEDEVCLTATEIGAITFLLEQEGESEGDPVLRALGRLEAEGPVERW